MKKSLRELQKKKVRSDQFGMARVKTIPGEIYPAKVFKGQWRRKNHR